ncbi:MAG: hypothetical protein IKS18_05155 [Lachnospiraceae bacterium]|nr:hypothetical protein [Lachnospiraceae bacterium]
MDYHTTVSELNSVRAELRAIIAELEEISFGIRRGLSGIGTESCASAITMVISSLCIAQKSLDKVNESAVFRWFSELHGKTEAAQN